MRAYLPILILAIAAASFLALTKCKQESPPKPPEKIIQTVETQTLQPETIQITLQSQGTVEAATGGTLNVEVIGRILHVGSAFQTGGRFKKGDILLTLDPTDYQAAKAKAEASLARAKLALQEEQVRAEQARKEWESAKSLAKEQPTPLVLREPQLQLAQSELRAAKQSAELAIRNLERTQLRAPYDGVLTEKLADVGQVVTSGPGGTVAKAYSTETLEVRLPIPASEITFLSLSRKATVELRAEIGGRIWTWPAHIDRDTGRIDPQTRFHHLVARIDKIDNHPDRPELLPGQFVAATIQGKTIPKLYRIPRHAFTEEATLYLVTPENTLQKRAVTILHHFQDTLLISEGLNPGETLCLTRLQFMNDGLRVKRSADAEIQETPRTQSE